MNKEQYLKLFKEGNYSQLIYTFYTENFNGKIHKPFLQFQEFTSLILSIGVFDYCVEKTYKYYENKFNVVRVHKEGILIAII